MTRRRDIGEFKGRTFAVATVVFLAFGLFLYSRFDFHVDPKMIDEMSKQQAEISNLEKRIESLEKENSVLQIELKKPHDQTVDSHQPPASDKKPDVSH
jgi:hypothetical protein